MNTRPLAGLAALAAVGLAVAAPPAAQAGPATHRPAASHSKVIYACTKCRAYYSAASAKKMGYKDPMGHTLTKMTKAPAGYANGDKMGGKM